MRYTCEFIDISWNTAGTAGANQMKPKPDHYSARRKVGGDGETSGKTFPPPLFLFFPPISPLLTLDERRPFAAHRLTRRWWRRWWSRRTSCRRTACLKGRAVLLAASTHTIPPRACAIRFACHRGERGVNFNTITLGHRASRG